MATGILEPRGVVVAAAATVVKDEPRRSRPNGEAVAALLAAMLGMLTLALVNQLTAMSAGVNVWVHSIGKLWMPGAQGIGPYSGKETLALVAWIVGWAVLRQAPVPVFMIRQPSEVTTAAAPSPVSPGRGGQPMERSAR